MGVERLADHELLRARLPVSHRHVIAHAIAEYHLLRLFRRDMPAPLADDDDQFHFIIELLGHLRALHRIIWRSEEHTSELQSLMRISYAVFCLKNTTTLSYTPIIKI